MELPELSALLCLPDLTLRSEVLTVLEATCPTVLSALPLMLHGLHWLYTHQTSLECLLCVEMLTMDNGYD